MQWLIALGVFVVGLGLLVLAVRSSKKSPRPRGGGMIGAFGAGFDEAFDRRGALIAEQSEKRLEMEGEDDSGDPPETGGSNQ